MGVGNGAGGGFPKPGGNPIPSYVAPQTRAFTELHPSAALEAGKVRIPEGLSIYDAIELGKIHNQLQTKVCDLFEQLMCPSTFIKSYNNAPDVLTMFNKHPVQDYAPMFTHLPAIKTDLWSIIGQEAKPMPQYTEEELAVKTEAAERVLRRDALALHDWPNLYDKGDNPYAICPKCKQRIRHPLFYCKIEPGKNKYGEFTNGQIEHLRWSCRCGYTLMTRTAG